MGRFVNVKKYTLLVIISILSALIVVFQALRITALIDYSFFLENAYKIINGLIPYRDFNLAYPPGSFYYLALFLKIIGVSSVSALVSVVIAQILLVLISFDVIRKIFIDKKNVILGTLVVALSGHTLIPSSNYDIGTTIIILIVLDIIYYAYKSSSALLYAFAGVLAVFTVFFKQNVGLIFPILVLLAMIAILFSKAYGFKMFDFVAYVIGVVIGILVTALLVTHYGIWNQLLNQLFIYPSLDRDTVGNAINVIMSAFSKVNLLAIISAILLGIIVGKCTESKAKIEGIIAIYLCDVYPLAVGLYSKEWNAAETLPWYYIVEYMFVLLLVDAFITRRYVFFIIGMFLLLTMGTFLVSQGVAGSTYGIYPLLIIFMALSSKLSSRVRPEKYTLSIITMSLVATLIILIVTNARQGYIDFSGEYEHSRNEKLQTVSTNGGYIRYFDELVAWIDSNVAKNETIVEIPGENPLFFTTSRMATLRYFQLNSTMISPYTIEDVAQDCITNKIDYIFVAKKSQCAGFIDYSTLGELIGDDYKLVDELENYYIYKIRE